MAIQKMDVIWFNGKLVAWDEANIHVMSHVIHYGSSFFEGIRCYETPEGTAVFRLTPHIKRLFDSAKIYRTEVPFTQEQIVTGVKETIRTNKLRSGYIRPVVFRGAGTMGLDPTACPVEVAIITIEWGKYLGDEAMEQGVDVCVSSWNRFAANTMPSLSKAGGNYMNSQLVKLEAMRHGYTEGIALDSNGLVSEGSGENLFLIRNGMVYTPPLSSSILEGITRDTVLRLLKDQEIEVCEQALPRELLYIADELFFTGTAAEVTPIRSVDGITIGQGNRGPITTQVQQSFFDVVQGKQKDFYGWLEYVDA